LKSNFSRPFGTESVFGDTENGWPHTVNLSRKEISHLLDLKCASEFISEIFRYRVIRTQKVLKTKMIVEVATLISHEKCFCGKTTMTISTRKM
jgi:hypothetical protein